MKVMTFEVSDIDSEAIEEAIAKRHAWNCLPDAIEHDETIRGRLLAEVCRGWIERVEVSRT